MQVRDDTEPKKEQAREPTPTKFHEAYICQQATIVKKRAFVYIFVELFIIVLKSCKIAFPIYIDIYIILCYLYKIVTY